MTNDEIRKLAAIAAMHALITGSYDVMLEVSQKCGESVEYIAAKKAKTFC